MAPFPETEIMTIKRIEVALRKLDFKLLKDGAYKLHEKFHSGFHFEYIDILKDLYCSISNHQSVPSDIKDILIPTIEDILKSAGIKIESFSQNQAETAANEMQINDNNLLDENIQNEEKDEPKEVTSLIEAIEDKVNQEEMQKINENLADDLKQSTINLSQEDEKKLEPLKNPQKYSYRTISIFYGSQSSKEQNARILKYKNSLSKLNETNVLEFLNLTGAIIEDEKIDVADLSLILNVLKEKENKINLFTNSKSPSIAKLLTSSEIEWSIFDFEKNQKKVKFFPYLGLIGLFKCLKCKREHFEVYSDTIPLSLYCPNCKNQMFLDFSYADDQDCSINMEYYNSSLCSLASSKIWLIINPPNDEKITMELLKNALKVSNMVEDIYITSPKAEIVDKYKSMFYATGKNVRIDASSSALNNFWAACG